MIGAPCSAWFGIASLSVATLGETVNEYTCDATWPYVETVTVLNPVLAAVETATGTVRLVGLFTVISPTAKLPSLKLTCVTPWMKLVADPVIVIGKVDPCGVMSGVTLVISSPPWVTQK